MRLRVVGETLREHLAVRHPDLPHPMIEVMGGMMLSRAIMAGVRFRLFDRLAQGPRSAADLAAATGCHPRGLQLLLDALVACGYLKVSQGRYTNTPPAQRWLLTGGLDTAANFIRYNYDQWEWVNHLEQFIEWGEARNIHEALSGRDAWRRYLLGVRDTANLSLREVLAHVRSSPPPERLLDIGAGHCQYSIHLCRKNPQLQVTVVDLEPAAAVGKELVAEAGLQKRFTFQPGSAPDAPLGENYDLVFLFNLLHHLEEPTIRTTLQNIQRALKPGGQFLLLDEFAPNEEGKPRGQLEGLLALFFGLASGRRAYSLPEVRGWLAEAKYHRIRHSKLRDVPLVSLLVAER